MKTIVREASIEIEIKKSRFLGRGFLRSAPDDALAAVKALRAAERDATHHVWAYRIGRDGEQARYSDDGEPRGTAGPPVLEILKAREATNTLIVVTRYYGGIKLGAGGLARAYGETARRVLEESGLKEIQLTLEAEAPVPYPLLGPLENFLAREEAEILGKTFGEFVVVRFRIAAGREACFREFYSRLTAGKAALTVLERGFR